MLRVALIRGWSEILRTTSKAFCDCNSRPYWYPKAEHLRRRNFLYSKPCCEPDPQYLTYVEFLCTDQAQAEIRIHKPSKVEKATEYRFCSLPAEPHIAPFTANCDQISQDFARFLWPTILRWEIVTTRFSDPIGRPEAWRM